MKLPVYLDNAATTPLDLQVADRMLSHLTGEGRFGNPAAINHALGRSARDAVEEARTQVADLISARPQQIIWTSGATESINLALKGAARNARIKGNHLVTLATEHKAGIDVCEALAREGFELTVLTPDPDGILKLDNLARALRPGTILISVMHVNNETGVIQNIAEMGRLTRERNILLHVDAAQSAGKLPIDVEEYNVDLMSLSAHKVYGPKGVGALFFRDRGILGDQALIHGGGHEQGLRAGTLATHQIVGMGAAFSLAGINMEIDYEKLSRLKNKLWSGLSKIEGAWVNCMAARTAPAILNIGIEGIDSEDLLLEMDTVALSTGAACSSILQEPSHVLRALGLSDESIASTLRLSLGRFTTEEEIDYAIAAITNAADLLRG